MLFKYSIQIIAVLITETGSAEVIDDSRLLVISFLLKDSKP